MRITRLKLKNWRNFRDAEANLSSEVSYILGPNASGKSNILDALRFLRDVAKPKGGGLQTAIDQRGGVKKIRCLHARKVTEICIEVDVADDELKPIWTYSLTFNTPGTGSREPEVRSERVVNYGADGEATEVLSRPNAADIEDSFLLRETHIEQPTANAKFRELGKFFSDITYVHLVPQLLKFGDEMDTRKNPVI